MAALQFVIEIVLIGLLAATLIHAVRLERGRAGIKRDRAELEQLIAGFDGCNRQAEAGAERLRIAADTAGRTMARHIEGGANLKDDLTELVERGERLANQLGDTIPNVRDSGRRISDTHVELPASISPRVRSDAERELLRALRVTR